MTSFQLESLESRTLLSISYSVTDLGTLGGGLTSALGVSAKGLVVGESRTAANLNHAFSWNGNIADLGTLGGLSSSAAGINSAGAIVGNSLNAGRLQRAFLDQAGTMRDLGTLGGTSALATAIDEGGAVVGSAAVANGAQHAFYWSGGKMRDLGTLGGTTSIATAMSSAGVVGQSDLAGGGFRGFLSLRGQVTQLSTLSRNTRANAINDRGQIAGFSFNRRSRQHAVVWQNGGLTDLGTLGGDASSALGINHWGQVVGQSNLTGTSTDHAFLWQGGTLVDLNGHISTAGWVLSSATAINDAGQIVGKGSHNGKTAAFLLTPVGDTIAPIASLSAPTLTLGGGMYYRFTVTYTDNSAVAFAKIDSSDITVTGPAGWSNWARLVSVAPTSNDSPLAAIYEVKGPGGRWDATDDGSYTISVNAGQVSDTTGNTMAAGVVGAFRVSI